MNLELLKETRKKRKVTQADMAKSLGYSGKAGYCFLESGKIKVTIEQSKQIKNILNLTDEEYRLIFLVD